MLGPFKKRFMGEPILFWVLAEFTLASNRDFNIVVSTEEKGYCSHINPKSMEEFTEFILEAIPGYRLLWVEIYLVQKT